MLAKLMIVFVIGASLSLAACAARERAFAKAGVSESQRNRDIRACWNYVFNTPEGRGKADMVRAARVIGGGPLALVVMSVEKSKNNHDPKKQMSNMSAHNDCMVNKGYTVDYANS